MALQTHYIFEADHQALTRLRLQVSGKITIKPPSGVDGKADAQDPYGELFDIMQSALDAKYEGDEASHDEQRALMVQTLADKVTAFEAKHSTAFEPKKIPMPLVPMHGAKDNGKLAARTGQFARRRSSLQGLLDLFKVQFLDKYLKPSAENRPLEETGKQSVTAGLLRT